MVRVRRVQQQTELLWKVFCNLQLGNSDLKLVSVLLRDDETSAAAVSSESCHTIGADRVFTFPPTEYL